jgi:hypothetical protein
VDQVAFVLFGIHHDSVAHAGLPLGE